MILLHLFITPLRIPSSLFRLACLSLLFHSVVSVQSFVAVWVFCLCLSVKFVGESLLSLVSSCISLLVISPCVFFINFPMFHYEIQFICVQFPRCLLSFLSFSLIYSLSLFQFLVVSSYSCTVPVTVYCGDCFPWFPQSRHFGAPSVPLAFVLLSHITQTGNQMYENLVFFITSHFLLYLSLRKNHTGYFPL